MIPVKMTATIVEKFALNQVALVLIFRLAVSPISIIFSSVSSLSSKGVVFPSTFSFFCSSNILTCLDEETRRRC